MTDERAAKSVLFRLFSDGLAALQGQIESGSASWADPKVLLRYDAEAGDEDSLGLGVVVGLAGSYAPSARSKPSVPRTILFGMIPSAASDPVDPAEVPSEAHDPVAHFDFVVGAHRVKGQIEAAISPAFPGEKGGAPFFLFMVGMRLEVDGLKVLSQRDSQAVAASVASWDLAEHGVLWAGLWSALDVWAGDVAAADVALGLSGPRQVTGSADAGPKEMKFPYAFTNALVDAEAHAVYSGEWTTLVRRWKTLRPWEELVQEEVARLRDEELTGSLREIAPGRYDLTNDALTDLKERAGLNKGFLYVDKKHQEQFLSKVVRLAGGGLLHVGISWYGQAGPWVQEWREERRRQPGLPGLSPATSLDGAGAATAQVLDDAQRLMRVLLGGAGGAVLGAAGAGHSNKIRLPNVVFYNALGIEGLADRRNRLSLAIRALSKIRFMWEELRTKAPERGYGTFVVQEVERRLGTGGHGDGEWELTINSNFMGCLSVYQSQSHTFKGDEVFQYDYNRKASPGARQRLGWDEGGRDRGNDKKKTFVKVNSGAPFFGVVEGFDAHQCALLDYLYREETRNNDSLSNAFGDHAIRQAEKLRAQKEHRGSEARSYDSSFCPLLPSGRRYAGALSHFKKSPERGRSLRGIKAIARHASGPKPAGLLQEMGFYVLPTGRAEAARRLLALDAIKTIRGVVEGYLCGVVAMRSGNDWLTPDQAISSLRTEDLLKAPILCFMPEDWHTKQLRRWEAKNAELALLKRTAYAWKATTDAQEAAEAAVAYRDGAPSVNGLPLCDRLRGARRERSLSQKDVALLFGVSREMVAQWEAGTEKDERGRVKGRPIRKGLVPSILRWIESGEAPGPETLARRRAVVTP